MNEHKAREKEMADARRRFISALASGQAAAVDRQGVRLEVGQKVLYRPTLDLFFDVIAIAPVMDPNVPPGLINVTLSVTVPVQVPANRPVGNMIAFLQDPSATGVTDTKKDDLGDGPGVEPPGPPPAVGNGEAHDGPKLVLTDGPDPRD